MITQRELDAFSFYIHHHLHLVRQAQKVVSSLSLNNMLTLQHATRSPGSLSTHASIHE